MKGVTSTRRTTLRQAVLSCLLDSAVCAAEQPAAAEVIGRASLTYGETMTDAEFEAVAQALHRDGLCWNSATPTHPPRWTLTVAGRRVARRRRRMDDRVAMSGEMNEAEPRVATTDHRVQHSLRTILIPLDVPNGDTVQPSVPAFTELAPFLPAKIPLPRDPIRDSELPRLIAVRVHAAREAGLVIHRTPAGLPTHLLPPQSPLDTPATCLSLWEVPEHGHVLACENLRERYDRRNAQSVRDALEGDLATCLAPFDLTVEAPLTAVFPRLNSRLPGPSMYLPLSALAIPADTARATSVSVGTYIEKPRHSEQCEPAKVADGELYDCLMWIALSARHSDDRRTLTDCLRRYRRHPNKPGVGVDLTAAVVDARLRHLELTSFIDHHNEPAESRQSASVLQTLIGRFLEREDDVGKELIQLCDIAEQALRLRRGSCRS